MILHLLQLNMDAQKGNTAQEERLKPRTVQLELIILPLPKRMNSMAADWWSQGSSSALLLPAQQLVIVLLAIIAQLVQHQQRRCHVQSELSGRSRRDKTRAAVVSALLDFLAQRQA